MVHLIVTYDVLEVSTVTGQDQDILKTVMGWHPLVGTETRRRPILSLGARGAAVGFLVVDPVKKRGSGGVLDLKVATPFEVIPVRKVDVINATSSGPSVIYGC